MPPDGLTVIFVSNRPGGVGGYDLFEATRASPDAAFDNAAPMMQLNTSADEYVPGITHDGLTLYFERYPGGHFKSTRTSTSLPFDVAVPAPELGPLYAPTFTHDANEAFWGHPTLYRAVYDGTTYVDQTQVFDTPEGEDGYPTLSSDALTLYFVAVRGVDPLRIYQSTRPAIDARFGPSAPVDELSLEQSDDPEISFDGRTLVFVSSRSPSKGGDDMFMSTRTCQ